MSASSRLVFNPRLIILIFIFLLKNSPSNFNTYKARTITVYFTDNPDQKSGPVIKYPPFICIDVEINIPYNKKPCIQFIYWYHFHNDLLCIPWYYTAIWHCLWKVCWVPTIKKSLLLGQIRINIKNLMFCYLFIPKRCILYLLCEFQINFHLWFISIYFLLTHIISRLIDNAKGMVKYIWCFYYIVVFKYGIVFMVPTGLRYKYIWYLQHFMISPLEGCIICNLIFDFVYGNIWRVVLI